MNDDDSQFLKRNRIRGRPQWSNNDNPSPSLSLSSNELVIPLLPAVNSNFSVPLTYLEASRPEEPQIAYNCLLIPVFFVMWWYWTKKTAQSVARRVLIFHHNPQTAAAARNQTVGLESSSTGDFELYPLDNDSTYSFVAPHRPYESPTCPSPKMDRASQSTTTSTTTTTSVQSVTPQATATIRSCSTSRNLLPKWKQRRHIKNTKQQRQQQTVKKRWSWKRRNSARKFQLFSRKRNRPKKLARALAQTPPPRQPLEDDGENYGVMDEKKMAEMDDPYSTPSKMLSAPLALGPEKTKSQTKQDHSNLKETGSYCTDQSSSPDPFESIV